MSTPMTSRSAKFESARRKAQAVLDAQLSPGSATEEYDRLLSSLDDIKRSVQRTQRMLNTGPRRR